jgi:hypothetical protein
MWFIVAIIIGVGLTVLFMWMRNRNISVRWYDWLIGALGLLLLFAAIQHYAGSLAEAYTKAGWMGLLILGIPALILLVLAWQLIARRARAS